MKKMMMALIITGTISTAFAEDCNKKLQALDEANMKVYGAGQNYKVDGRVTNGVTNGSIGVIAYMSGATIFTSDGNFLSYIASYLVEASNCKILEAKTGFAHPEQSMRNWRF